MLQSDNLSVVFLSFVYAVLDLSLVSTVFYQFCDLVEKLEKLDEDLQEVRKLITLPPSHAAFFNPLSFYPFLPPSPLSIATSLFPPFSIVLLPTFYTFLSLSTFLPFQVIERDSTHHIKQQTIITNQQILLRKAQVR